MQNRPKLVSDFCDCFQVSNSRELVFSWQSLVHPLLRGRSGVWLQTHQTLCSGEEVIPHNEIKVLTRKQKLILGRPNQQMSMMLTVFSLPIVI